MKKIRFNRSVSWRKWTKKEEDLLKKIYPDTVTKDIAGQFGRTVQALSGRAKQLGIKKDWTKCGRPHGRCRSWSGKEIERLQKLFPLMPNVKLRRHFPKRGFEAIVKKARVLGLRKTYINTSATPDSYKFVPWKKQQELLKELYSTAITKELEEKFGRSKTAIKAKAIKMGLHKKNRQPIVKEGNATKQWSKKDEALLKRLYPTTHNKDLAVKFRRTDAAIKIRSRKLGLTKDPEKYIPPLRPDEWSGKDIETLCRLREKGYTVRQIAENVGRSLLGTQSQITKQIANSRIQGKFESRQWTKEEDDYLVKYYGKKSVQQFSAKLKRTVDAVKNRIHFWKLSPKAPPRWTDEDLNTLKKYYSAWTDKKIAEKVGRTAAAIRKKAYKMGLVKIR